MISNFAFLMRNTLRRLGLRAVFFVLLSIAVVVLASVVDDLLADLTLLRIDRAATETMLSLLASSMLPVTTFALTTMVSSFSAATDNVTPRATPLVTEDQTAQNAISVFLGAFIYAVTALVWINLGVFGDEGSLALFVATLAVMVWIVVTFLRWMDHLSSLVRVDETTKRVERAAGEALDRWIAHPGLGARPHGDWGSDAGFPVSAARDGYVQHIDIGAIAKLADDAGTEIRLDVLPGAYVDRRRTIAATRRPLGAAEMETLRGALTVTEQRHFASDFRFGLIVLAEIASRALSPGINDPGTAITALAAGTRLLARWFDEPEETAGATSHPAVYAPRLSPDDLLDDFIRPIARDGAGILEVAIRLQKMLGILARAGDGRHAELVSQHARAALARSLAALTLPEDQTVMRAAASGNALVTRPE
ncbi:DUF2254 domain-containing protein [Methylobrevis albus]|uniref:DUF2254 domain-containing protein n=1 Tax=Methylobrevis albus TaxID=2793297 RepID=A0A931I378_9HYPH|nr:DUF2254 domain-containing protein [Methylobrevis albus]MBH0238063.1 DUF2254 domain-containing protein [Methylobrevis albus]